jgi:HD-like signal output (HDOD) protein
MNTLPSESTTPPADARSLVAGIDRLVAFPEVWVRANRLIDRGRSAAEIARVLEMDTDLSARLLRMVNSAFYRLASPVETISRAVTVIGMLDLRDLAMLTVARRLFTGIPGDLMNTRRFWRDAVATGVFAGLIGRRCNLLHAERVLVMGVIHNIGLLAICQHLPVQAREILFIADGDHEVLAAAEQEILGYTHQDVGEALLRRWRLPESLCQVAANHHRPERAEAHALEVAIVHVASVLTGCDALGLDSAAALERVHPAARAYARVDEQMLDRVRDQGEKEILELAGRFLG